eukprot:g4445.t1
MAAISSAPQGSAGVRRLLGNYKWLGFDLDHCMTRYKLPAVYPLVFNMLRSYLVEHKGYVPLAVEWAEVQGLCQKGLVVEWGSGNVLQLDAAGRVAAARHGRRLLAPAELAEQYGDDTWEHFEALKARQRSASFTPFCTYFDAPAVPLVMLLVEQADAATAAAAAPVSESIAAAAAARYARFAPDLFDGFNFNYDGAAFALRRGGFFPALQDNIDRYVHRRPWLRAWLAAQRAAGRRILLGTNSNYDFADLLLRHTLGEDWRAVLADDAVVVNCQKPGWFDAPDATAVAFRAVAEGEGAAYATVLGAGTEGTVRAMAEAAPGAVYAQGCLAGLLLLPAFGGAGAGGAPGEAGQMLYFGDSYTSDVLAARRAGCGAVLVLEELADDLLLEADEGHGAKEALAAAGFGVSLGVAPGGGAEAESPATHFLRQTEWGSFFCDRRRR